MHTCLNLMTSSDLFIGAKKGDLQRCIELIQQNSNINGTWSWNKKINSWEENLEIQIPEELLRDRICSIIYDLHAGSFCINAIRKLTPLHISVRNNHLDCVKTLLENGANVNARDGTLGYTPLHYAALYGNPECARLLLDHGAEINIEGVDELLADEVHICYNGVKFITKPKGNMINFTPLSIKNNDSTEKVLYQYDGVVLEFTKDIIKWLYCLDDDRNELSPQLAVEDRDAHLDVIKIIQQRKFRNIKSAK